VVRSADDPRLYDALIVNAEALRIDYVLWNQPAWRRPPGLSSVLDCLMHALTCDALGEAEMGLLGRSWLRFAVENQREARPHFTQGFRNELTSGGFTEGLLEKVHDLRRRIDHLDQDDGPYPSESFPAHLFAPEKVLLDGQIATRSSRTLQPEIEELVVLLNVEISDVVAPPTALLR
jgi:hypothetical protein